jgi:hypothetical protein
MKECISFLPAKSSQGALSLVSAFPTSQEIRIAIKRVPVIISNIIIILAKGVRAVTL